MAKEEKKYVYIRLKDRKSSAGQIVGSTHFNNATVEKYEEGALPTAALIGLKNHIFEYCKESDYNAWVKAQEEQAEIGRLVREQRMSVKKAQVSLQKDDAIKVATEKVQKEGKKGGKKETPAVDAGAEDKGE